MERATLAGALLSRSAAVPGGRASPRRAWLVRVLQVALTVAITWLIVDRLGLGLAELGSQLGAVDPALWVPDPWWFAAASLLLLGGYFVSAGLWGVLVHDLGGPRLPLGDAIRMFMIANLGRYVPGKVWQIAGLAVLARGRGVSAATAAGAAVLGQAVALAAAATVGMAALLAGPEPYRRWGIVGAAGLLAAAALLAVPAVFRALLRAWVRLTGSESPERLSLGRGLRWLALYLVNWVVYALSFWVLVRSFSDAGGLLPIASAFAAAYVLGYLMVFAPAGLGPREGFLIVFLTPQLGVGLSGVVAIVARLWTTLVELLPAAAFWLARDEARGEP